MTLCAVGAELLPVRIDGRIGFIDLSGTLVVPAEWDGYNGGFPFGAWVKRDHRWGAIDSNGNVLLEPTFKGIYEVHGSHAILRYDGRMGLAHATRGILLPCRYDKVTYASWG